MRKGPLGFISFLRSKFWAPAAVWKENRDISWMYCSDWLITHANVSFQLVLRGGIMGRREGHDKDVPKCALAPEVR